MKLSFGKVGFDVTMVVNGETVTVLIVDLVVLDRVVVKFCEIREVVENCFPVVGIIGVLTTITVTSGVVDSVCGAVVLGVPVNGVVGSVVFSIE